MTMSHISLLFVASLLLCGCVSAQYEYGAFVGTDSVRNNICAWNTSSAESTQCTCTGVFGVENYTPAYTVNTATRQFVYLKSSPYDSSSDRVVAVDWNYFESNNTFVCGTESVICDSNNWYTNITIMFSDPALNTYILVDSTYSTDRYYMIRVWKFDESCSLTYVDSFKRSPVDMESMYMYDPSNHRLYILYQDVLRLEEYRLRSISIESGTLNYDFILPLEKDPKNIILADFNKATGYIVLVAGPYSLNSTLSAYQLDPLHLNMMPIDVEDLSKKNIGPTSSQFRINWKLNVFVDQHAVESGSYDQNSWFINNGTEYASFNFRTYIDNGWLFDPLEKITPVNINTATASELEDGLPGVDSSTAQDIVDRRNLYGFYSTVDALLIRVPSINREIYAGLRPWAYV